MKNSIRNTLKIAAAGGLIALIWLAALTQRPADEPGVAPAHADIGTLGFGDDGQEFTRAMAALGLTPRRYDFNGNVMYFAAGTTTLDPMGVEELVSREMVERGINSGPTTAVPPTSTVMLNWERPDESGEPSTDLLGLMERNAEKVRPQTESMMRGELVTTLRSPERVRMESVLWNGTSDEILERMKDESIPAREKKFTSLMGGYRFIEAIHDPTEGMTDVSAVWSSEDFDPRRMTNESFLQQEPDPNVPACMGCERLVRMQSLEKDEPIRANEWHTNVTVQQTYDFYVKTMTNRGWKESGVQRVLDEAAKIVPELDGIQQGGKIVNLEKDGRTMQIVLIPDPEGGTDVFSQERFEGANQILGDTKFTKK